MKAEHKETINQLHIYGIEVVLEAIIQECKDSAAEAHRQGVHELGKCFSRNGIELTKASKKIAQRCEAFSAFKIVSVTVIE